MLCIIDIETNKGRNFTADDFAGVVILLMTGITAETLGDAVNLARIAEKSGIVTIGIPSHNIPPESEDFQEFRKYADAVIFSRYKTERVSRRIVERISDLVNKSDWRREMYLRDRRHGLFWGGKRKGLHGSGEKGG